MSEIVSVLALTRLHKLTLGDLSNPRGDSTPFSRVKCALKDSHVKTVLQEIEKRHMFQHLHSSWHSWDGAAKLLELKEAVNKAYAHRGREVPAEFTYLVDIVDDFYTAFTDNARSRSQFSEGLFEEHEVHIEFSRCIFAYVRGLDTNFRGFANALNELGGSLVAQDFPQTRNTPGGSFMAQAVSERSSYAPNILADFRAKYAIGEATTDLHDQFATNPSLTGIFSTFASFIDCFVSLIGHHTKTFVDKIENVVKKEIQVFRRYFETSVQMEENFDLSKHFIDMIHGLLTKFVQDLLFQFAAYIVATPRNVIRNDRFHMTYFNQPRADFSRHVAKFFSLADILLMSVDGEEVSTWPGLDTVPFYEGAHVNDAFSEEFRDVV
jgi:hypothetical protein